MAGVYSGTLIGDDKKPLSGAKVVLKYNKPGVSNDLPTTTTDKNGQYLLVDPIASNDVTLTFSKNSYSVYSIKNPQPSGKFDINDSQISPQFGGTLELKGLFEAGKYFISSLSSETQNLINWELLNAGIFAKNNNVNYVVIIEAAESKVTNYDREEFQADGITENKNWAGPTGTFKTPALPTGSLATLRAENFSTYVKQLFTSLGVSDFRIYTNILTNQGPEYVKGTDNPDDPKYKSAQYVNITVALSTTPCIPQTLRTTGNVGGRIRINTFTLYRPPNTSVIRIDPLPYPDRFQIGNGEFDDYYIQSPNALGDILAWEFIVYLSIFSVRGESKNAEYEQGILSAQDKLKAQRVPIPDVAKALNASSTSSQIRDQIKDFMKFCSLSRPTTTGVKYPLDRIDVLFRTTSFSEIIDKLFYEKASDGSYYFVGPLDGNTTRKVTIRRLPPEPRPLPSTYNRFLNLKQIQGSVTTDSEFTVNICNQ